MEEQAVAHTRKIGKTAFAIGLKPAENAKGTLEDKLKRMIKKSAGEHPVSLSSTSE